MLNSKQVERIKNRLLFTKEPDLALLKELEQVSDFLSEIQDKGIVGEQGVKGDKGDPGKDGKDGRDGIDGKEGADGKDGKDGEDGRDGINGQDGLNGSDGEDGKPGLPGKDGSPDTAKQIVEKLQTIKDAWLEISAVKGFEDYMRGFGSDFLSQAKGFAPRALQSLYDVQITSEPTQGQTLTWNATTKKWVPGTAVGGDASLTLLTATGTVDGNNTDFTFTSKPTYIVSDGVWYVENTGWTWSGSTATMTVPPQSAIWGFS